MKRSSFGPRKTPMLSGSQLSRTSIKKKAPKPMKHGKVPPNAAERRWMASVAELGCIVCRNLGYGVVPCAVHHIVEGGRRVGHMFTIGLCDPGHHQQSPDTAEISRHPDKARFEDAYGTEYELLAQTQLLLSE